jgi:hypothetical protein
MQLPNLLQLDSKDYEKEKLAAESALGKAEFEIAWAGGRAMAMEQIIAYIQELA